MTAPRRFCRFRHAPPGGSVGYSELPSEGMCLNVFLLAHPPGQPERILVGQPSSQVDWGHIGALGPDRLARIGDRWMLPSSQLLLFESPEEGVARLLAEQLDSSVAVVRPPRVFSEAYARVPGEEPHWDLHFLFEAEWPTASPPRTQAWRDLQFTDVRATPRNAYARAHGDVLALAGLPVPA